MLETLTANQLDLQSLHLFYENNKEAVSGYSNKREHDLFSIQKNLEWQIEK